MKNVSWKKGFPFLPGQQLFDKLLFHTFRENVNCYLSLNYHLSLWDRWPSVSHTCDIKTPKKKKVWPEALFISRWTHLSPFPILFRCCFFFYLTLFLLHFSLLPSIAAPSEVNSRWKDNGMSSGLAWPLHLLQLWHHIGKLKQERKEREREGGEVRGKKEW